MLKKLTKIDLNLVLGDIKKLGIPCAFVAVSKDKNFILGITSGSSGYRAIPASSCSISMSEKGSYDEMSKYAMELNTEYLALSKIRAVQLVGISMGCFEDTELAIN